MHMNYKPTELEKWVSKKYIRMNILTPGDLTEETIARIHGIYIFKKEIKSFSYQYGRFKSITIDSRISNELQREHFYHEWCHLLRHVGMQNLMPAAFKEMQENDAKNFTRYAAIPFHMLDLYNLNDPNIIEIWKQDFNVSPELCLERLFHINRRIKNEKLLGVI